MIYSYFGDRNNPISTPIWVEIQWTAWLLDGGIPLILAYSSAIGVACWFAWRAARERRNGTYGEWGALVLAYNLGILATTFSYPVFLGQMGVEFWLLNAAFFAAGTRLTRRPGPRLFPRPA
jgi:hypothetical protein